MIPFVCLYFVCMYKPQFKKKPQIPKGGMFEYVTGATYFTEFVEWLGYGIAIGKWQGLAFAIFTFCNLFPRAVHNHAWYHQKFDNYPKNRKIFFPFLF